MLHYDRIDLSNKTVMLTLLMGKNVWIVTISFFDQGFRFQDCVSNGSYDLMMTINTFNSNNSNIAYIKTQLNISDTAIITVKGVDCRCIIHDISKAETISLLENYIIDDCGHQY